MTERGEPPIVSEPVGSLPLRIRITLLAALAVAAILSRAPEVKARPSERGMSFVVRCSLCIERHEPRGSFHAPTTRASALGAGRRVAGEKGALRIEPSASLTVSHLSKHSALGSALAISGDGKTVVAGAKWQGPGAIYVFVRQSSGWTSTGKPAAALFEPASRPGDEFGSSVAISGNGGVILAAAYNGHEGSQVFVYMKPRSGWTTTTRPAAVLTRSGLEPGGGFGYSVSLSGDGRTALIGEWQGRRGAADVYTESRSGWKTTTRPNAVLGSRSDLLGSSVALNWNGRVATSKQAGSGCPYTATPGSARQQVGCLGGVEVFQRPSGGWRGSIKVSVELDPSSSRGVSNGVGDSLSLSARGQYLAAGDSGAGATWLYSKVSGHWGTKPYPYVRLGSPANSSWAFQTVAVNAGGTRLLAGVDGSGQAAYVYDRASAGWRSSDNPAAILTKGPASHPSNTPSFRARFGISGNGALVIAGGIDDGRILIYRIR
jgi:hypothetical protein